MALQMIWPAEVDDFDALHDVFDLKAETRQQAGLVTSRVASGSGSKTEAAVLFRGIDREKALDCVGSEAFTRHKEPGGVRAITNRLLGTV